MNNFVHYMFYMLTIALVSVVYSNEIIDDTGAGAGRHLRLRGLPWAGQKHRNNRKLLGVYPQIVWKQVHSAPQICSRCDYSGAGIAYSKTSNKVGIIGHGGYYNYMEVFKLDGDTGKIEERVKVDDGDKGYGGDAVATSDGTAIFMTGVELDGPVVLYKMDDNLGRKWDIDLDHKCTDTDPDSYTSWVWVPQYIGRSKSEQNFPRKAHLSLSNDDKTGFLTACGYTNVIDLKSGESKLTLHDSSASHRVSSAYPYGSDLFISTWNSQSGGGYVTKLLEDYSSSWELGLEGDVYEIIATSTKVFASTTVGLDCISATTGKLLWSKANEDEDAGEMRALEVSDDEQFLYVGSRNPLQVLEYRTDDGELLQKVKLSDKIPNPREAMLDLVEHNGKVFCTGYSKVSISSGNVGDGDLMLFTARVDFFGNEETPTTAAAAATATAIAPESSSSSAADSCKTTPVATSAGIRNSNNVTGMVFIASVAFFQYIFLL